MPNVTRGLMEYYGISSDFGKNEKYFKQISLRSVFTIDQSNPSIGTLIKAKVYTDIEGNKMLKTVSGRSQDGQILTGSEFLVYGVVEGNLYYAADNINKTINSYRFTTNFCSSVVMPKNFKGQYSTVLSAVVEDIYIDKIDERSLFCSISLILFAK